MGFARHCQRIAIETPLFAAHQLPLWIHLQPAGEGGVQEDGVGVIRATGLRSGLVETCQLRCGGKRCCSQDVLVEASLDITFLDQAMPGVSFDTPCERSSFQSLYAVSR